MTMDKAWDNLLYHILRDGDECAPRGKPIKELLHRSLKVDMAYPVLICPERKLNYRFMFAEAGWILSGSNLVCDLDKYNPRMREFSDDGVMLAGAYGVPFVDQLDYVVETILKDRDTRQATMTFWRRNPQPSKDIPCTVAIDFKVRNNALHAQVFMRSSDAWLGVPYDVFSFTMMACAVLERLHLDGRYGFIGLGYLYLTAASSHLYQPHWEQAEELVRAGVPRGFVTSPIPREFYDPWTREDRDVTLLNRLTKLQDAPKTDRWWVKETV